MSSKKMSIYRTSVSWSRRRQDVRSRRGAMERTIITIMIDELQKTRAQREESR